MAGEDKPWAERQAKKVKRKESMEWFSQKAKLEQQAISASCSAIQFLMIVPVKIEMKQKQSRIWKWINHKRPQKEVAPNESHYSQRSNSSNI